MLCHRLSSLSLNLVSGNLLAIVALAALPPVVQAQPPGLHGSYLGVATDIQQTGNLSQSWFGQFDPRTRWLLDSALAVTQPAGVTAQPGTTPTRDFQGRLDLQDSPFSLRGKLSTGVNGTVLQPILSYDLAIARNANLYAGAGYSFVTAPGKDPAQLPANSLVLVTGAEAAITNNLVIYGDAQFRLNQPITQTGSPPNLQIGVGYRF